MIGCGKVLLAFALLVAMPVVALAQTADTASPPAAPQPVQPKPEQPLLKPEQLDALVAPIALYPDPLLVNVLAASTYPLEVVQADRWLTARKSLKGERLKGEVVKQSWDESVKALTSTPSVLSMMSDKLDWTKALGDAVLAQQPEVMDAIQRLREKAQANNKLTTTKQQKVSVQAQQDKQVIVIEPADADTMYVPYYDPAVVYGTWPYAEYPPYYFAAPPYIGAGLVAAGIVFGAAIAIGRWGNYWGGGCNWINHNFSINRSNNIGNNWQHNPAHRQGVKYNNAGVAQRFGNNDLKAGAANRMDHRGRDGQQGSRPGQDRPGAGDRGGDRAGTRDRPAGDRAGAGKGNRPSTANRSKGGGERAKAGNRGAGSAAATRGRGDSALGNISSGRAANVQSARGQASLGGRGGSPAGYAGRGGGGGYSGGGGGGGFRGGGGGGGGRGGGGGGGGGRRSDLALKHDIALLGHLDNGLGYYRFSYLGSSKAYVGVIAQEVEKLMPEAVTRGRDGYLRVYYDKLGLTFRSYRDWLADGARIPTRSGE